MAKLSVSMDTENKTLSVSIDGKTIPNAKGVSVHLDGDYGYLDVTEYEVEGDVVKSTRYSAYANEQFSEDDSVDTESLAKALSRRMD